MYVNTTGLVLRETAYRDSSKILTILTGTEGKLTISARGALRKNSRLAAATQFLVFSEMTLYANRDRWTVTEARSVEQFRGLQNDIKKLALGSYFAELTEAVSDEDSPNPQLLPLCLNALYALSEDIKEPEYIKPAFEMKLMAVSGFAPIVSHCSVCGVREMQRAYLNFSAGSLGCIDCAAAGGTELSAGAIRALQYIIGCEHKKLFSFSLGDAALRELGQAAEGYLLGQLERRFRTLEYYKSYIQ